MTDDVKAQAAEVQDCSVCDNGTACACQIAHRMNPDLEPWACGCMGFCGCPECGRPDLRVWAWPSQGGHDG